MPRSLSEKTRAPKVLLVPAIRPVDTLGGLDFVCFPGFSEQFSVCVGLEELVPVEQLPCGIGELKEPVRLAPFEPFTISFDGLDQSHFLQPNEVIGERRRCDTRIFAFEFLFPGRAFFMTDNRPGDFVRVVSLRTLNAAIGSSPAEPSAGVSWAASRRDIVY